MQVDAEALFRFVNEEERADLSAKADAEVAKRYEGRAVPPDRLRDERTFYLLHAALRDADSPKDALAASVLLLRRALVLEEAQRIQQEYDQWIAEEFPPHVSDEEMKQLIEDAKKNSLADLLTSYGYKRTLSALRSLGTSGAVPTQT